MNECADKLDIITGTHTLLLVDYEKKRKGEAGFDFQKLQELTSIIIAEAAILQHLYKKLPQYHSMGDRKGYDAITFLKLHLKVGSVAIVYDPDIIKCVIKDGITYYEDVKGEKRRYLITNVSKDGAITLCGISLIPFLGTRNNPNAYAGYYPVKKLKQKASLYITDIEDKGYNTEVVNNTIHYSLRE